MEKLKVADLKNMREDDAKRPFVSIVLLKSNQKRTAKNGSEFLTLDLGDNSGSFSAMCFESSQPFQALKDAKVGTAYEIAGIAEFYQGRFSPKIESARRLEDGELSMAMETLVEVSPLNPSEMREELERAISEISNDALRATVNMVLEDTHGDFFKSTAAVKMHHAYVYGLLEHTLKTARMVMALLPLYPFINRDLAIAGCILHDVGKVLEYEQSPVSDRTRTGILHGHVVLGYRMVRRAGIKCGLNPDTLERLEHIILSHQGEPEWGAAVRAATPEAVFVSSIDNFDAKMGAVEYALRNAGDSEFVEVGALKSKILSTPADDRK